MTNRIIFHILTAMTKKERKQFREFLVSSYHNSNPLLDKIVGVIDKWLSGSRKKTLEFEVLLKKTGTAASTMEKSLSQIMGLLREFIQVEAIRQGDNQDYGYILNWLHERKIDGKWLEMESRKYAKRQASLPESSEKYHQELSLSHAELVIRSGLPRVGGEDRIREPLIRLEVFYVVNRLKYACASVNQWRVFAGEKPTTGKEYLLGRLTDLGQEVPLLGKAYHKALDLLEDESPGMDKVRELLDFMEKEGECFSQEDISDIYGYLLNSCFRGVDRGHQEKSELVYKIYMSMLDRGLLTAGGYMIAGHFKNLVSLKVRFGKLEEARQFIHKYSEYLGPEDRDILRVYAFGLVSFYDEDYKEAITLFKKVVSESPEDLFWSVEARIMLCRAYFEAYEVLSMAEQDEMHRNYDAFRVSISRNQKLSAYHKSCYQNFIRIFYKLMQRDPNRSKTEQKERLEELHKETESKTEVANKKWLLEAISRRMIKEAGR